MYCTKCGTELANGVCPNCASEKATVNKKSSAIIAKGEASKASRNFLFGLGIVAIFCFFFVHLTEIDFFRTETIYIGGVLIHKKTTFSEKIEIFYDKIGSLFVFILYALLLLGIYCLIKATWVSQHYICICDDKIYGKAVRKFSIFGYPTNFNLSHDEITSASVGGGVSTLKTVKGDYGLMVKNAYELADLINRTIALKNT